MTRRNRTYEKLVERAAEQHGFLRIQDAEELGVAPAYLRKLVTQGRLEHRERGIYRLLAIPATVHDEFQEAAFLAPDGVIAGEAAIALWGLADVNPREIEVILPRQVRRTNPRNVRFRQKKLAPRQVDDVEGIRVLAVDVAIHDMVVRGTEGGLVEQAIANAYRRGLIGETAAARLRVLLADRSALSMTSCSTEQVELPSRQLNTSIGPSSSSSSRR